MNNLSNEQLEFHCEKGIDFLLTWINNLFENPDLSFQEHAVDLLVNLIHSFPGTNLNFLCAFSLLYTHSKLPGFNDNSHEISSAMVPEFQEKTEYFKQLQTVLQQHSKTLSEINSSVTIFEEIKVITKDAFKTKNDLITIADILQVIYIHYSSFVSFNSSEKALAVLQTLKYLDCIDVDLSFFLNEKSESPCFQILKSLCGAQIDEELYNTTNESSSFSTSLSMIYPPLIKNDQSIEHNQDHFTLKQENEGWLSEIFSNNNSQLFSSPIKQAIDCPTPEADTQQFIQNLAYSQFDAKITSFQNESLQELQLSILSQRHHMNQFSSSTQSQQSLVQLAPFFLEDSIF